MMALLYKVFEVRKIRYAQSDLKFIPFVNYQLLNKFVLSMMFTNSSSSTSLSPSLSASCIISLSSCSFNFTPQSLETCFRLASEIFPVLSVDKEDVWVLLSKILSVSVAVSVSLLCSKPLSNGKYSIMVLQSHVEPLLGLSGSASCCAKILIMAVEETTYMQTLDHS